MSLFRKRKYTVRHWRYGYQHDHVGSSPAEALGEAMKCAGHVRDKKANAASAAWMQVHDNHLEYVPYHAPIEHYYLIEGR